MSEQVTSRAKALVTMACAYAGISVSELCRRMGWKDTFMFARLKTGRLSYEEWQQLAAALGAEITISITFPDGKIIE